MSIIINKKAVEKAFIRYQLLETDLLKLINKNQGFAGYKSVGIYEMVGYSHQTKTVLIIKPICLEDKEENVFILTWKDYKTHCKVLQNYIICKN